MLMFHWGFFSGVQIKKKKKKKSRPSVQSIAPAASTHKADEIIEDCWYGAQDKYVCLQSSVQTDQVQTVFIQYKLFSFLFLLTVQVAVLPHWLLYGWILSHLNFYWGVNWLLGCTWFVFQQWLYKTPVHPHSQYDFDSMYLTYKQQIISVQLNASLYIIVNVKFSN